MENPTFHLEGIVKSRDEMQDFSGPLNLILMLLSKNKIEIRDLRISEILDQYLEHIAKLQAMDLDVASEFVQMASHLVYLKTRTLLAGEEQLSELDELINSLEQLKCQDAYMSVKAITAELSAMAERGLLMFPKAPEPIKVQPDKAYQYSHEPAELLNALIDVFSRAELSRDTAQTDVAMPKRIIFGVRDKCAQLLELLKSGRAHTLKELYQMSRSRTEVVATFISVLELCSVGSLEIIEKNGELTVSLCDGALLQLPESVSE